MGTPKWSISSWACCPQNITFRSTPVLGLRANDTVDVSINRTGAYTCSIDAHWQGQSTTLNAAIGSYFYNYADVTLEVRAANVFIDRPFSVGGRNAASSEARVVVLPMCPVQVYSVLDCDELAPPMRFSKLALHDQSGLMKSPAWQRTEGRACSGKVTLNNLGDGRRYCQMSPNEPAGFWLYCGPSAVDGTTPGVPRAASQT